MEIEAVISVTSLGRIRNSNSYRPYQNFTRNDLPQNKIKNSKHTKRIMIPNKLKKGDNIRIIAPSESLSPKLNEDLKKRGVKRLESLGLNVSFGKYVDRTGSFDSASVDQRLEDLYEAFEDPNVRAVLAANGGSSANQLLKLIDYDKVKKNPKIFCGLSDLTELSSALYTKTGMITYYGPHFSMMAASKLIDLSLKSMQDTFFAENEIELEPSEHYLNSRWDDEVIVNNGFWTINEGEAEGACFGGNLMTFNFLMGGEFFPEIKDCILYLEENHIVDYKGVQKEITEVLNHPEHKEIRGVVIGRFQKATQMSRKLLTEMIKSMKELREVPVVGNVDISHTSPIFSIPFGGKMKIKARENDKVRLIVTQH